MVTTFPPTFSLYVVTTKIREKLVEQSLLVINGAVAHRSRKATKTGARFFIITKHITLKRAHQYASRVPHNCTLPASTKI